MMNNRSIPRCTVIPELAYEEVTKAADWLCDVFGFTVRIRIGNHRVQLNVGDGAMVVIEGTQGAGKSSVLVRIDDVHGHHQRTKDRARILRPPADHPFGERQYTVEDIGGHRWTFSQSIADVAPESWGGSVGQL